MIFTFCIFLCCLFRFFNNEYVFPPRFYFETFKPTEETGAARERRLRTATETHQRPVSGASALSCSPHGHGFLDHPKVHWKRHGT